MLEKYKRPCRIVGLRLTDPLEALVHCQNVVSILSTNFTLARVQLFIVIGHLLITVIGSMIFLSPFLQVTWMPVSTIYFPAHQNSGIV